MSDTLRAALLFLVNTLFDLYLFALAVRLILVWVHASYLDPITQFISRITDFIIVPLRRIIPNIRRLETATVLIILLLEIIKFALISALSFGFPNIFGLMLMAFADSLKLLIQTFFYAILLQAILSFIQPHSPINRILLQFNSPIMAPLQRLIPPINGIDITPIPALLILQLLLIVLVNPLFASALALAYV